jgi:CheY-like chemotaxis protein
MKTATAQPTEEVQGREREADGPTVMVVEDYVEVRDMISMALGMSGYRVVEARNGLEAVELARREHPDAILMDLNMPLLNGFDATRRIREMPEMVDVPVLAITAYGTPDYHLKALAAGCNKLLTKPLDLDQLEMTLKLLLTEAPRRSG